MRLITRSRLHDVSLLSAALLASSATRLSLVVGAGIWAVGVAFQIWSKSALKRTNILSTTGPYAVCRHPFYLANAIFDLGICVMSGNPWLVALYPFGFWAGYGPTMRKEEEALSALYPEAYAEFRRTTPTVLPISRRIWRDRRAPLSWENLRVERQLSRTVRYGAFPLLVWLAARVWADPANPLSPGNLAIFGAGVALGLIGLMLYGSYERRRDSPAAHAALRFAPHAAIAAAAVFFIAVAVREVEAEDFALAATVAALLVGWALAAGALGTLLEVPARALRVAVIAGLVALAAWGVWLLQAPWALPAALGAVLAMVFAPLARLKAPRRRLAAGLVLLAIGLASMGAFHRMWRELRTLEPIRAALREEVREDDLVVVLKDRELSTLVGSPGVDREVTGGEIGVIAMHRAPSTRLFVLAEEDDLRELSPRLREHLRVRREFHVWLETFYLLEVAPHAEAGGPALASTGPTFPCAGARIAHN